MYVLKFSTIVFICSLMHCTWISKHICSVHQILLKHMNIAMYFY